MNNEKKNIYRFGSQLTEGNGSMRAELGGKGAGLAEMSRLSVPLPPGFTLSARLCRYYLEHGGMPASFDEELASAISWLESIHGKQLGSAQAPLLVSVRSGAAVSMPGMMDTILNVGLTRATLQGLAQESGSKRFALDSYRRLLQMFGPVVLGVPKRQFDEVMEAKKAKTSAVADADIPEPEMIEIVDRYEEIIQKETGNPFPQDVHEQLAMAIHAVFRSWNNERAVHYRKLNHIDGGSGTAVTIQAMVFGNRGDDSGTGVGFTRNPSTGEAKLFGEFLANAQGEDIVAGVRTPASIADLGRYMPKVYKDLCKIACKLERHFRDAQDFEFTIENQKLFLLQTRPAKRSAAAAVRIAVDLANEGLISKQEAVTRIKASSISEIVSPTFDFSAGVPEAIAQGLPASPGASAGQIALSADEAVRAASQKDAPPVILVTQETTADDIHGMAVAAGLLTAQGGMTSHAAVVARGMGKCCVTGTKGVIVNPAKGSVKIGDVIFREGDWISLDGASGKVFSGKLPLLAVDTDNPYLNTLLRWAAEMATIEVRANADTPQDARLARESGATGLGLCRTEHMFFAVDRLPHMRSMILATSNEDRKKALESLLPMQQEDFEGIFREMSPLPVTVRLLDPPLHEFLPSPGEIGAQDISLAERAQALAETNPMMGHRGCRLSITYPEILTMQVRAILQAALKVSSEGFNPHPEIMVPLVACAEEIHFLRRLIDEVAAEVFTSRGRSIPYHVGTMIELPRAAVCAATFAGDVDFVSFGTNDLTQMTFGFSRDDARKYLNDYLEQGILPVDPFVTIDRDGVGSLMELAIRQLKARNPGITIGVCGEHGGDAASIAFFQSLGVDYVSCSPARIPAAQLAMAQAEIEADRSEQMTECAQLAS